MYAHETDKDLRVTKAKSSNILLQVPTTLKRRLAMDAVQHGLTVRSLILEALLEVGYDIPSEELMDKRKTRADTNPSKHPATEDKNFSDYCTTL